MSPLAPTGSITLAQLAVKRSECDRQKVCPFRSEFLVLFLLFPKIFFLALSQIDMWNRSSIFGKRSTWCVRLIFYLTLKRASLWRQKNTVLIIWLQTSACLCFFSFLCFYQSEWMPEILCFKRAVHMSVIYLGSSHFSEIGGLTGNHLSQMPQNLQVHNFKS